MRILVIGGAGYIGSVLSERLWLAGHEVTVLDRLMFGGESLLHLLGQPRFELVPGDLREESLLNRLMPGHDAIVLLAAIVGEPACNRDPQLALDINLQGARKVLAAAREHKVARLVFASTCSNYGVSAPDQLVDETAPLQPISAYAESKVAAEEDILRTAGPAFCPTVLRFATAFGISPRMRFDLMVSDFTMAAVHDRKLVVYGEQFWRPFVHIQDISAAVQLVLEAPVDVVSGEVFNVGSNVNNMRKIELAETVQRQVEGTELEFVKKNEDPRSYRVDFQKIESRLGFQAEWSIERGIEEVREALTMGVWPDTKRSTYYN